MKVRIDLLAKTNIVIEINEEQEKKLASCDFPLDIDGFELRTGILVDTDEAFETGSIEVDDVDLV
jgi:hypothetical protein